MIVADFHAIEAVVIFEVFIINGYQPFTIVDATIFWFR